jgi:hypothetical protein
MSSIQLASTSGLYPVLNKEAREIRLVTIVSSLSSSERIECKLAIFPLKDAPQYAALSYVWGDIKETAPITLNDTEVRVTTNLLAALQRLSQKPRGTYFWIDALCINQRSTEEKNYQVPLMRNIYQQAECVLMWLGKEADNSHLAMSMIETWGKTRMRKVILEATETSKVAAAVLENIKDPFNKPSWTAMRYFFERPYWRRIWIVQEVVLSRDAVLICGEIELKFLYLYAAANSWTDLALLTNETSTLIKYHICLGTSQPSMVYKHPISNRRSR